MCANDVSIVQSLITFMSFHGLPLCIVSDSGSEFRNSLLTEFAKLQKTDLHPTTAKNSNSNIFVESYHSTNYTKTSTSSRSEKSSRRLKTLYEKIIRWIL